MKVTAYWSDGYTAEFTCDHLETEKRDYQLTSEDEVILVSRSGVRYLHMDVNNLPTKIPKRKKAQ